MSVGLKFGPLGPNTVHLCGDMQNVFAEDTASDEKHDALMQLYRDRFSQQVETAEAETILSCWP